jgi:flagellar L-ring protein precursor FlgH
MTLARIALVAAACAAAVAAAPSRATDGRSLYREDSFQPLTADRKAHRVGDLITVQVYEDASASSTADTTTGRDANVGVGLQLPLPHTSPFHGSHQAAATTNNDFNGQGQTERSGRVVAQLTVPVVSIGANGDLAIAGTQVLEINGEKQTIHIEGKVRAIDVSATNTVLSTRVAEAHLSIAGNGTVTDQQKPGWWQRLLTLFGV